jgi:hypothetical protein
MYKAALLLVIICILPLSTIGETLHYGVKTGVTFANQDFDYTFGSPDFDTHIGWDIGFFAEWRFVSALSMAAELHYVQKGHVIKVSTPSYMRAPTGRRLSSFSSRVDYLSLSLLAKFSMPLVKARTYLFIGPRLDIKVGQKATLGFDELYDEFESSVFGGTIGIGQELPIFSSVAVVTEVYYHHDFTEAYKTDLLVVKNRAWGILVGVEL